MLTRSLAALATGVLMLGLAAWAGQAQAQQDVTLKAATFLPRNLNLTKDFLTFVETVNREVEGVRITYVGGPEAIPGEQQPAALERGVLDIVYTAMSRFAGIVPEAEALLGTAKSLEELRESGAIDALNAIFAEKANARLLAIHHLGLGYNLYLKDEPTFTDAGVVDLSGAKIRTSATYREFLDKLGATTVSVPSAEVYTALERGVAEGLGWPAVDVVAMGLDKVIGYRVEPTFFNAPNISVISLDAWNRLPGEQQGTLEKLAAEHSEWSVGHTEELMESEAAELQEKGIQFVTVPDPEAYRTLAFETVWERIASRDAEGAEMLKPLFYGH
jgi:TRAP-type C4-dicarboxylate transport system substrate-binding protein